MENGLLIVGLGNPGPKYERTRHNMGFMVVDRLFSKFGGTLWQEKFSGMVATIRMDGQPVVLLKPTTFMNLSGRSMTRAASFYRISVSQIIVIHDDLDLEFGTVRIKQGGGNGGHNGLASCTSESGDPGYTRIRTGIGRPRFGTAASWVLEKFSNDEEIELDAFINCASDAVEKVIQLGIVKAMNHVNKRKGETQ